MYDQTDMSRCKGYEVFICLEVRIVCYLCAFFTFQMLAPIGLHPQVFLSFSYFPYPANSLVEAPRRRHGSLDGQATDVLPALLQQGDEVVDGQHDVADQLLRVHANVSDGNTHAEHLLQLELDGGLDLVELASEVISVRDRGRELAG